jgi:hypothetical protein
MFASFNLYLLNSIRLLFFPLSTLSLSDTRQDRQQKERRRLTVPLLGVGPGLPAARITRSFIRTGRLRLHFAEYRVENVVYQLGFAAIRGEMGPVACSVMTDGGHQLVEWLNHLAINTRDGAYGQRSIHDRLAFESGASPAHA